AGRFETRPQVLQKPIGGRIAIVGRRVRDHRVPRREKTADEFGMNIGPEESRERRLQHGRHQHEALSLERRSACRLRDRTGGAAAHSASSPGRPRCVFGCCYKKVRGYYDKIAFAVSTSVILEQYEDRRFDNA